MISEFSFKFLNEFAQPIDSVLNSSFKCKILLIYSTCSFSSRFTHIKFYQTKIHISRIHKINEMCFNLNEFISKIYVIFVKITETILRIVGWYVDINYSVRLKPKEWYNARFSGLIKIIWCRITKINWSAKNAADTVLVSIENNLLSN